MQRLQHGRQQLPMPQLASQIAAAIRAALKPSTQRPQVHGRPRYARGFHVMGNSRPLDAQQACQGELPPLGRIAGMSWGTACHGELSPLGRIAGTSWGTPAPWTHSRHRYAAHDLHDRPSSNARQPPLTYIHTQPPPPAWHAPSPVAHVSRSYTGPSSTTPACPVCMLGCDCMGFCVAMLVTQRAVQRAVLVAQRGAAGCAGGATGSAAGCAGGATGSAAGRAGGATGSAARGTNCMAWCRYARNDVCAGM
eukprot:351645-Chlamydomonas_euryale.AAC.5